MPDAVAATDTAHVDADGEESDDVEYVGIKVKSPKRKSTAKTGSKRKRTIPQGSDAETSEALNEVPKVSLPSESANSKRIRPDKISVEVPVRRNDPDTLTERPLDSTNDDVIHLRAQTIGADPPAITIANFDPGFTSMTHASGDVDMEPVAATTFSQEPRSDAVDLAKSSTSPSEGSEDTDSEEDDNFKFEKVPGKAANDIVTAAESLQEDVEVPQIEPTNYKDEPTAEQRMLVDLTVSDSQYASSSRVDKSGPSTRIEMIVPPPSSVERSHTTTSMPTKASKAPTRSIGVYGDGSKRPTSEPGRPPSRASERQRATQQQKAPKPIEIEDDEDDDPIQDADEIEEIFASRKTASKSASKTTKPIIESPIASTPPLPPQSSRSESQQHNHLKPTSPFKKGRPASASAALPTHTRFVAETVSD